MDDDRIERVRNHAKALVVSDHEYRRALGADLVALLGEHARMVGSGVADDLREAAQALLHTLTIVSADMGHCVACGDYPNHSGEGTCEAEALRAALADGVTAEPNETVAETVKRLRAKWRETHGLPQIEAAFACDPDCPVCDGTGAVCEDHPDVTFGDCCGAAGKPCGRVAAGPQATPGQVQPKAKPRRKRRHEVHREIEGTRRELPDRLGPLGAAVFVSATSCGREIRTSMVTRKESAVTCPDCLRVVAAPTGPEETDDG